MSGYIINYNLDDVPTVKAFLNSRKRYKFIVGPFGPLPEDTEFLTPTGWKKISDYKEGDLVAQWHQDTGEISFIEPIDYIVKPADYWINFECSKYLYMKMSPEHRVPFYDYNGKFKVLPAYEIALAPNRKYIPNSFTKKGKKIDEFRLRLLVALSADGHKPKNSKQIKVSLRKERKKERLKWLLQKLGIDYKISKCKNRPTEEIFTFYFDEFYKVFPKEWYGLDSSSLEVIIDEMIYWDGGFYGGNDRRYFTSIKENAEFIQFAAHATGRRAYINRRSYPDKENWKGTYHIYISGGKIYPKIEGRNSNIYIEKAKTNEFKYCFVLPTTFFVVRQKGVIYITGNSGKSSGCVMHLFYSMIDQKPNSEGIRKTRYAIIRNTVKQLRDTTKKTIDSWIPPVLYTWKESQFTYFFKFKLDDGTIVESEWLLRALDDPDQVRDLLSLELSGAWMNEGREIREDIFRMLRGRIGRYPSRIDGGVTYSYIIIDSNPPDTEHWLYKQFEEMPNEDPKVAELFEVFHQPSGLSPEAENIHNLPPNYYEELCIGQDEDWIRVHVHGEYGYVKTGKPVFPNYKDSIHCAKEELKPIRALPLIIGMDFGLYPACVFTQQTEKGQLLVIDEIVSEEPTDIETFIAERLLPKLNTPPYFRMDVLVIGDPAGKARSQLDKRTCFTVLKEHGLRAYPAYTNSLMDRIMAVNFYLTRFVDGNNPAFILSPKCVVLRKGLISEYKFTRLRTSSEKYSDLPEKNLYSHVADALQYACLGYSPNLNVNRIKRYGHRNIILKGSGYSNTKEKYRGFT